MLENFLESMSQLLVPVATTPLLILISLIYAIFFSRLMDKVYLAGLVFTLIGLIFLLFEIMSQLSGWYGGAIETGRLYHRISHLATVFVPFAFMNFLYRIDAFKSKKYKEALKIASFVFLGYSILTLILSFVIQDSFISLNAPSAMPIRTLGDSQKGAEGFLYSLRDILISISMTFFFVNIVIALIKTDKKLKFIILTVGIICALLGGLADMTYVQFGRNFIFPKGVWFSCFSLGLVFMMVAFIVAVLVDFFAAQKAAEKANAKVRVSENRFRVLTSGIGDAIFSLDKNYNFISINKIAEKAFLLRGDPTLSNFLNIFKSERQSKVNRLLIKDKLDGLIANKEPITFRAIVPDPNTSEPNEYEFSFVIFEGEQLELIGRAETLRSNKIVDYIELERLRLSMENYIVMVQDISVRLTNTLNQHMDQGDALQIRMGLQEILMNAVEHGNLNITFDEKTEIMESGRYLEFIQERQVDPRYKDRRVSIDYLIDDKKVEYRIADEGDGFDYSEIMDIVENRVDKEFIPHGRGIKITYAVFDEVHFNKKGNVVLLRKFFKK